jgi:hypothetical protein
MLTKNEKAVPPSLPTKVVAPKALCRGIRKSGCSVPSRPCVIQCERGYYLIKRNLWTRCRGSARVYSSPARARMALSQMKNKIFEAKILELPQVK